MGGAPSFAPFAARERASAALSEPGDLVAGCHISPASGARPSEVPFMTYQLGQNRPFRPSKPARPAARVVVTRYALARQEHVSRAATPSGQGCGE